MHLRLVRQTDSAATDRLQVLGSLIERGRSASLHRTGLHRQAQCWAAAEARTAVTIARADLLMGTSVDASIVMAARMAVVAQEALGQPANHDALRTPSADAAFDSASLATWLRAVTTALGARGDRLLADEAGPVARAVLNHPGLTTDVLADTWISVFGFALLEELAGNDATPDAEARLIQRTIVSTLSRLGLVAEPRIVRLTGVDRLTLAQWLRFGPPSASSSGHQVSAPVCAALVGMTSQEWRALDSCGRIPAAANDARGARRWDEGEVIRWAQSHPADQCHERCQRHQAVSLTIAAQVAGGQQVEARTGIDASRPCLRVVR